MYKIINFKNTVVMKVKVKNLMVAMAILVGFGLASCSKDNDVVPQYPEKEKPLPPHLELPIAPDPEKEPHR